MGRPEAYYAELNLRGGRIIMRMRDELLLYGVSSWNLVRHTSADYEIHMIVKGDALLHLDSSDYPVPEQHAIIIAPDLPHSSKSRPGIMTHFYFNFQVEGARLQKHFQSAVKDCTVFHIDEDTIILIEQLLHILSGNSIYRQELIETILPPIMVKALESLGIRYDSASSTPINQEQERRNKIETFFQADMPYGKSEDRLARELGISRRHLARVLQKYYGMNFRELMLSRRMDHAAWMLRNTEDTVTSISERLNYTSLSAFSQAFRAIYGKTPRQYRMEYR